jgi:hypothetical protein
VVNAFVADVNATGGEHFLDHAQAERKSEIEPNRIRDHLRRKTMATIEGVTRLVHNRPMYDLAPPVPTSICVARKFPNSQKGLGFA